MSQPLLATVARSLRRTEDPRRGDPQSPIIHLFADLHPPRDPEAPLEAQRWQYDVSALASLFHCSTIHEHESPPSVTQQGWFNSLERARIMSLSCQRYKGVHSNLERGAHGRRPEDWLWVSIFLDKIDQPMVDPPLQPIWKELQTLKALLPDQARFARKAQEVCVYLEALHQRDSDDDQACPPAEPQETPPSEPQDTPPSEPQETPASEAQDHPPSEPGETTGPEPHPAFPGNPQTTLEPLRGPTIHPSHRPRAPAPRSSTYTAYTQAFDEEIRAETLASVVQRYQYRAQLDRFLQTHPVEIGWRRRLQRYLQTKDTRSWALGQDEGYLDGRRLSQLIASPHRAQVFKREEPSATRSTIVSLLLDNSASMKGPSLMLTLWTAECLARVLERCHVKVEILGYTTTDWKGGPVKKLWESQGRPKSPGRLNALRHIIYKHAETPWRRARLHLPVALQPGLLKENIDGEALAWAEHRLQTRTEARKILVVISDGAPADRATHLANPRHLLETHLQQVVSDIESKSDIALAAIGIGYDVQRWYQRAVCIRSAEELGSTIEGLFIELLGS